MTLAKVSCSGALIGFGFAVLTYVLLGGVGLPVAFPSFVILVFTAFGGVGGVGGGAGGYSGGGGVGFFSTFAGFVGFFMGLGFVILSAFTFETFVGFSSPPSFGGALLFAVIFDMPITSSSASFDFFADFDSSGGASRFLGSGLNIAGTELALDLGFFGIPAAIDSAGFLLRVSVSIFNAIGGGGGPPGPGPGGDCD